MIIPDSQFDAAAQSVAQPDTDPLDRAASQVAGDQKVQLRASLYSSLMANPDMAAAGAPRAADVVAGVADRGLSGSVRRSCGPLALGAGYVGGVGAAVGVSEEHDLGLEAGQGAGWCGAVDDPLGPARRSCFPLGGLAAVCGCLHGCPP